MLIAAAWYCAWLLRFSVQEEREAKQPNISKNHHNIWKARIHNMRKEIESLRKQCKEARGEKWAPLAKLSVMLRKRLLALCRTQQEEDEG